MPLEKFRYRNLNSFGSRIRPPNKKYRSIAPAKDGLVVDNSTNPAEVRGLLSEGDRVEKPSAIERGTNELGVPRIEARQEVKVYEKS